MSAPSQSSSRQSAPYSFPRSDIRVVLFEGIADSAVDAFREAGYERIERFPKAPEGAALRDSLSSAHVVGIRSRTQLSSEALEHARKLVAIGCFCIGTDQVDIAAARRRGVPVFNAPYSNTRSVAELVVAEAILLLRGVPARNMACHRGEWRKSAKGSHEARGKTLGVVGYGHIGTQVGVLAEMLGMRVLYHDIVPKLSLGNSESARGLDDLLERSDVVTLHVPDTPETVGLIRSSELARMKSGAVLINASRGGVVDLNALRDALASKHLSGAAVDVFPAEPASTDDTFSAPLVGVDSALLTPHIGGSTEEAQANIGLEVAAKLLRYSDDGSTLSAVGFPEVALPKQRAGVRLLHVHENEPGMLRAINRTIDESRANVDAQFLQTLDDVGYVVTDVDLERDEALDLERALRSLDGTLRSRVLF